MPGDSHAVERESSAGAESVESRDTRVAVGLVRAGKRNAFAGIVAMYRQRLYGLSIMMLRDAAEAEELVQDAFVRAYSRLALYDDTRPFYPWLATIAVRLAQTRLRSRQARLVEPLEKDGEDAGRAERTDESAADPLDDLITAERARRLWDRVSALPSGERTAVMLCYRQEMKVAEIASALGVTDGTVKTLLFRARKKLRAALDHDEPVRQATPSTRKPTGQGEPS